MLSTNHRPPHLGSGKGRKREKDLQLEMKTALLIILLIRENNAKCTKPILSFPELGAMGAGVPPAAARQAPDSPGLDPAADRNWTQECTDQNLDQNRRQNKEQGPVQKPTTDEECESLVIPQL